MVFPSAVCDASAMEKSQLPPQAIKSNRIIGKIRAREIFVVVSNNFYRARPNRAARFRVAVHASAQDLSRNLRCNGAQFRYQPRTRAPVELKLQSAGRTKKKKTKNKKQLKMKTNKQTRIWKYITLFKSARVILLGGGRCGKTVVFTGSRQEAGSFSPVIAHHCLLEMIERRIREKRIIRKGGGRG